MQLERNYVRSSKMFHDPLCLNPLYCCLVRPLIKYASVAWFPEQVNRIERLERIQRKFTRVAIERLPWRDNDVLPAYHTRCQLLGLETLEKRRMVAQGMFMFKLLTGRIDAPLLLGNVIFYVPTRSLRTRQFKKN